MFQDISVVLVVAKATTLAFGSVLTYLSYRAYRRTGSPALRALATGIGLIVAGATLGGVLNRLLGTSLAASVSVQSVCTAAGFAVMTYSLYVETPVGNGRTHPETRSGE